MENTCLQKKLQRNTVLLQTLYETGQPKAKSSSSNHSATKDTIAPKALEKSLDKKKTPKLEAESCTQESVLTTKKPILNDKLNSLNCNTQTQKLSRTLVRDLTGKERGLKPFWNESTKALSQRLWCPTKIDCVDLDLSCLTGFVKNKTLKSWFSTLFQTTRVPIEKRNCQKIYSQLSRSLSLKTMEIEQQPTEKSDLKTLKIQLHPNLEQIQKLKKWFGVARYIYNKGLDIINKHKYDINFTSSQGLKYLRKKCVAKSNYRTDNRWATKGITYDARDFVVQELLEKYKTTTETYYKTRIPFYIQCRSKKKSQSITVRARDFNKERGLFAFLRRIKTSQRIPELTHDIKLHIDRCNKFYVLIPIELKSRSDNQAPERIISIDPGSRTFLTGYGPDGMVYHIGKDDIERLCRLNFYKSKLQSKIDKIKHANKTTIFVKRINQMQLAQNRMSFRIKNLVDEAHKKVSQWLLRNFKFIVLPKLNTTAFCRKRISKRVKNRIKSWRHCAFIARLKFKIHEYPNRYLIVPTEEYTSLTCSSCGQLHKKLGKNKTYNCSNCRAVFDRDVNASKNILLKTVMRATS